MSELQREKGKAHHNTVRAAAVLERSRRLGNDLVVSMYEYQRW